MEQQEQGWSTTAKVTAVLAGIGLAGAAAAGIDEVFNDGEWLDSILNSDAASAARTAATDIAGHLDKLGEKAQGGITDALTKTAEATGMNPAAYDLTNNADVIIGGPGTELPGRISFLADLATETGKDVEALVQEAATQAGVKIDALESVITNNPYKSVAAATAIAGGTGFVAGRSTAAQSQGHAHA